jgi:hypothetical protein
MEGSQRRTVSFGVLAGFFSFWLEGVLVEQRTLVAGGHRFDLHVVTGYSGFVGLAHLLKQSSIVGRFFVLFRQQRRNRAVFRALRIGYERGDEAEGILEKR